MSKIISENQDAWNKKSWINELVNNTKLAASLTDEYAHDVLEAVGEDYFPSLDSALADLSARTGLTASETSVIKRAALALVKEADVPESCYVCKEEEIPGNKEVPGHKLVKESPEISASTSPDVTAKGMNPGFRAYLDKKKEEKEGNKSEESSEEKKEEVASIKANKTAWFQGADEPTKEGEITSNSPKTLGYPKEVAYPHKPMETTAPGGQDSRPWEQKWFEGAATETKKVMGPKGSEFELKVDMQRIPKGEKPANASAKRLELVKQITSSQKKTKEINKQASEYSSDAQVFISKEIKHLMEDKGYTHERAVAAAMSVAREKGYKVPSEK